MSLLRCIQALGWIVIGVVAVGAPRSEAILELWVRFCLIAWPTTAVVGILYLLIKAQDQRVAFFAHIAWMGSWLTLGGLACFFWLAMAIASETPDPWAPIWIWAPLWLSLLAFARGLHPQRPREESGGDPSKEKRSLFTRIVEALTRGLPSPRILRTIGWTVIGLVAALSLTNTLPGVVEGWRSFYNFAWPTALAIGALPFLLTARIESTPFFTKVLWMGFCLAGVQFVMGFFSTFVVLLIGAFMSTETITWQVPIWATLLAFARGMYPLEPQESPWPEA